MLEHRRRQHEEPVIGNTILEEPGSGGKGDQMMGVRQGYSNFVSGAPSESGDAGPGTADAFDTVHQQEQCGSETVLPVLRAELNGLEAQKKQALQTFDEKILAISTTLRVMEERLQ